MSEELQSYGLNLIALVKKHANRLKYADKHDVQWILEDEGIIPKIRSTSKILLCSDCEGKGQIFWDVLTDYHKGEYDTRSKTCPHCEGSGSVEEITYSSVKVTPYVSKV